jgi:hypothetical protein
MHTMSTWFWHKTGYDRAHPRVGSAVNRGGSNGRWGNTAQFAGEMKKKMAECGGNGYVLKGDHDMGLER